MEIRLPLQTIRFKGGANVNMGILFWRRVSRVGVSVAWPALEPGKWVFEKHAKLAFADLQARPTREVIPSATYSRSQERATPSSWGGADNDGDIGLGAKWGLTSTVTLDATVNPDFSQVESDAFQVEVNQRFPVYFSEKRPFFMEGAGIFNLAGNGQGDASMLYAVNTRNIVDPIFGAKLTGSAGRVTFGALTAVDQSPGRTEDPNDPLAGKEKFFQVGRAQMSLKPGSYAGAIAAFTNLAGRTNAVAGGDVSLKFKGSHQISGFALASTTDEPEQTDRASGAAMQANYSFSSRRVNLSTQLEHYDRAFTMDTAFLNRTGVTDAWMYIDYNFYPDKDRHSWIRRIVPFTFLQGGRDRVQGGEEYVSVTGARLSFTRQGFFRADVLVVARAMARPRVREIALADVWQRAVVPLAASVRPRGMGRCGLLRRDRSVPWGRRCTQRSAPSFSQTDGSPKTWSFRALSSIDRRAARWLRVRCQGACTP